MPYLSNLERVLRGRMAFTPQLLRHALAGALARHYRYDFYLIDDSSRPTTLKTVSRGELAEFLAAAVESEAGKLILPTIDEVNEAAVERARHMLSGFGRVTRPVAERALRETLDELIKLRLLLAAVELERGGSGGGDPTSSR